MRQAADLLGLGNRRSLLVIITILAALAASLALYFSLGTSPAAAQDDPVRNLEGHRAAQIPLYDENGNQVGTVHDQFSGSGDTKHYFKEIFRLTDALPNTTYQAYVLVYFNDPTCQGTPFRQPSVQLVTDKHGRAHEDITGSAPGRADSPIPPAAAGLTHGFVYEVVSSDGSEVYQTPCTAAYEDVEGGPSGGPNYG